MLQVWRDAVSELGSKGRGRLLRCSRVLNRIKSSFRRNNEKLQICAPPPKKKRGFYTISNRIYAFLNFPNFPSSLGATRCFKDSVFFFKCYKWGIKQYWWSTLQLYIKVSTDPIRNKNDRNPKWDNPGAFFLNPSNRFKGYLASYLYLYKSI